MFSPLVIITNYNKIEYYWFYLICSVFYCMFMYSVIQKHEKIEKAKENYLRLLKRKDFVFPNGEKISDKEKLNSLQEFIEEFINELAK